MKFAKISILLFSVLFISCSKNSTVQNSVSSPDGNVKIEFNLSEKGEPSYKVSFKENEVIKTSKMGFDLKELPSLNKDFKIVNSKTSSFNETWEMPWGEQAEVVNNYNEIKFDLEEISELKRKISIVFKVYNDGLGFRYEFPKQDNL